MKQWKKSIVMCIAAGLLSASLVADANAYFRNGGKYSQDIYNKKYYNGATTYASAHRVSHWSSVGNSITSWNNTQNTRVWWQPTSTKSESIMDFQSVDLGSPGLYGVTEYFDGNTPVTSSAIHYWTKITINTTSSLSQELTTNAKFLENVAAHEQGHALGLDHNFMQSKVLMKSNPWDSYSYGITGPTDDEVAGVQEIYGTLY